MRISWMRTARSTPRSSRAPSTQIPTCAQFVPRRSRRNRHRRRSIWRPWWNSSGSHRNWQTPWLRCSRRQVGPKIPISKDRIFLSRNVEIVRFFLAGYTFAAHKILPALLERKIREKKKINAANRRKTACSGVFGVPERT